jgi:osmotically inducible protein OsmC
VGQIASHWRLYFGIGVGTRPDGQPGRLAPPAAVTIEHTNDGFRITRSALTLKADIPGLNNEALQQLAKSAEKGCPVSRLMNAEITLDATLA